MVEGEGPAHTSDGGNVVTRALDHLVPHHIQDPDARRRARVTVRVICAVLLIGPLLVAVHLVAHRPQNAAIVAAVTAFAFCSLGVLRWSRQLAAHWILACIHGLTLYAAYGAGGIRAPMMVWGAISPPIAVMLLTTRAAWGWWFVWTAEVLALVALERQGLVPPMLAPSVDSMYTANALIASTAVITVFSLAYERQKDRVLREEARAREAAERHNALRDQFVANISHELRSPLSGILGMTHLLERSGLSAQQSEYATLLDDSATTLLAIVDDLLDISRIEAGHFKMVHERFQLLPLLEKTVDFLALHAHEKGIDLLLHYDEVPDVVVGDPTRVRQLVTNLVSNAVKFTTEGRVDVALSAERDANDADGVRYTLRVVDTGPGIPQDFVDRIFLPFSQADPSSSRQQGGTGLGLAIAKEIAHRMDGALRCTTSSSGTEFNVDFVLKAERSDAPQVRSGLDGERVVLDIKEPHTRAWLSTLLEREGMVVVDETRAEGALACIGLAHEHQQAAIPCGEVLPLLLYVDLTSSAAHLANDAQTSTLFLPVKRRPLMARLMRLAAQRRGDQHTPIVTQVHRELLSDAKRVLVVEDGMVNQRLVTLLVEQCGHVAEIAPNGKEALAQLDARPDAFDAVLMDCQMPEMDGYEATRQARRRGHDLPILALTAHAGVHERTRCFEAGMNDFIAKPVDPVVLKRKLQAWLHTEESDSHKRSVAPVM